MTLINSNVVTLKYLQHMLRETGAHFTAPYLMQRAYNGKIPGAHKIDGLSNGPWVISMKDARNYVSTFEKPKNGIP